MTIPAANCDVEPFESLDTCNVLEALIKDCKLLALDDTNLEPFILQDRTLLNV